MDRKTYILGIAALICLLIFGIGISSMYKPVEVQSGTITKCVDPEHKRNNVIKSTIKTITVARKDSSKYCITEEQITCSSCQKRIKQEEQNAKINKQKEDAFITLLRNHDDKVLLYCRKIAGGAEADPYSVEQTIDNDLKKLRELALRGKKLCAPESLGDIEYKYGKSMDEILKSLPYVKQGIHNNDIDAMQTAAAHMMASKVLRDEAINMIKDR